MKGTLRGAMLALVLFATACTPQVVVEPSPPAEAPDVHVQPPNVVVEQPDEGDTIVNLPEQEPAPTLICLDVQASDGLPINPRIEYNAEPLNGRECVVAHPESEHGFVFHDVPGYLAPSVIILDDDDLIPHQRNRVSVVYRVDEKERCLETVDQFGNQIPIEIIFRHQTIGRGFACATMTSDDRFFLGDYLGYTVRPFLEETLTDGPAFARVEFWREHAANICGQVINHFGGLVPGSFAVDGIPSGDCAAIDVREEHFLRLDFRGEFFVDGYFVQHEIYIPADALAVSDVRTFTFVLIPFDSGTQYTCIQTLPSHGGEIIINGYSRGWLQDRREAFCTELPLGELHEISFGRIPGVTTAASVEFDLTEGEVEFNRRTPAYVVGLYDPDITSAICAVGLHPEGEEDNHFLSRVEAPVTIAGEEFVFDSQSLPCKAVPPGEPVFVSFWNAADHLRYARPFDITVPAEDLVVGNVLLLEARYRRVARTEFDGLVQIVGPAGLSIQAEFSVNEGNGNSFQSEGSLQEIYLEDGEGRTVTLRFEDIAYLETPDDLVIDPLAPFESGADFDEELQRWVWQVRYEAAGPIRRFCVAGVDRNDLPISYRNLTSTRFDTFLRAGNLQLEDEELVCRYLSVEDDHVIRTDSISGFDQIRHIHIPSGVLLVDVEPKIFELEYTPFAVSAEVCVTVFGGLDVGETFINGRSVGWSALPEEEICFWVDKTQNNRVSFSFVEGYTKPEDIDIHPSDFDRQGDRLTFEASYTRSP